MSASWYGSLTSRLETKWNTSVGLGFGLLLGYLVISKASPRFALTGISFSEPGESAKTIAELLRIHFGQEQVDKLVISRRRFPFRVRADLQLAIDELFKAFEVTHFSGVKKEHAYEGLSFRNCLDDSDHYPATSVPVEYEEVDVGEDVPVRVLENGFWLLEKEGAKFAVLLAPASIYGQNTGVQFQIAVPDEEAGRTIADDFFRYLERAVTQAKSYRGKVLSLETSEHSYSGASSGIRVHRLREVRRDQVVLPDATLRLLERNVIQFVENRPKLARYQQATRKGI